MSRSGDERFLGRWARRKAEAKRGGEAEAKRGGEAGTVPGMAPTLPAAASAPGAPPPSELGAAALLPASDAAAPADSRPIPPIESLGEDSDYSRFLAPDVSADLQRMALRKLFRLPGLVVRDGLDDYDDDYTSFEPLGDIVTADIRHQIALAEAAERERAARDPDAADGAQADGAQTDGTPIDAEQADASAPAALPAPAAGPAAVSGPPEGAGSAVVPRLPAHAPDPTDPAPLAARPRVAGKLSRKDTDAG